MGDTVRELPWLWELLSDFNTDCSATIILHSDGLSAIQLVVNPVFSLEQSTLRRKFEAFRLKLGVLDLNTL